MVTAFVSSEGVNLGRMKMLPLEDSFLESTSILVGEEKMGGSHEKLASEAKSQAILLPTASNHKNVKVLRRQ